MPRQLKGVKQSIMLRKERKKARFFSRKRVPSAKVNKNKEQIISQTSQYRGDRTILGLECRKEIDTKRKKNSLHSH